MCSVLHAVAALLLCGGVVALADDAQDKKDMPVSPETVLEKEVSGKVTVEFLVDTVLTLNIDSLYVPDASHAQIIKAKVPGTKVGNEFWVIVSREVATRMLHLGIADPAAHFRGKRLRVSGMIERSSSTAEPATTIYKIRVTTLTQLEHIRTP